MHRRNRCWSRGLRQDCCHLFLCQSIGANIVGSCLFQCCINERTVHLPDHRDRITQCLQNPSFVYSNLRSGRGWGSDHPLRLNTCRWGNRWSLLRGNGNIGLLIWRLAKLSLRLSCSNVPRIRSLWDLWNLYGCAFQRVNARLNAVSRTGDDTTGQCANEHIARNFFCDRCIWIIQEAHLNSVLQKLLQAFLQAFFARRSQNSPNPAGHSPAGYVFKAVEQPADWQRFSRPNAKPHDKRCPLAPVLVNARVFLRPLLCNTPHFGGLRQCASNSNGHWLAKSNRPAQQATTNHEPSRRGNTLHDLLAKIFGLGRVCVKRSTDSPFHRNVLLCYGILDVVFFRYLPAIYNVCSEAGWSRANTSKSRSCASNLFCYGLRNALGSGHNTGLSD